MTSIPGDVTLEELRAETARREKRINVANTEAKIAALDELQAGLEALTDVSRRAGVGGNGIATVLAEVKDQRGKANDRLSELARWQAHSDPESVYYKRIHG